VLAWTLKSRIRVPKTQSVRPCGVDLISDAPPFGRLWYGEPNAVANAIGYAEHRSRSHDAVIRVYDAGGNVIETHEYIGFPARLLTSFRAFCLREIVNSV